MPRRRLHLFNFLLGFVVVLVSAVVLAISIRIKLHIESQLADADDIYDYPIIVVPGQTDPSEDDQPSTDNPTIAPFIDLQPTIDAWLTTLTRNEQASVMIYDINYDRPAASYNANRVFNVASIYKLLFAYDGYRQLTNRLDDPTQIIATTKDKGALTLSQCLDLIIRESYNGCADVLNQDSQRIARVNSLMRELDMTNTSNIGLRSTAADLTKLLLQYWNHRGLSDEFWAQLSDSMLNQPPSPGQDGTIYNWRQGLPAGFSSQVDVYDKVGWESNGQNGWNIFADAAILDFTTLDHTYTMVVLTKDLTTHTKISQLGQMVEQAVVADSTTH